MAGRTFRRNIKLPTRKHTTEGKPIENVPFLKQVVIPVNQHFGAPNKPVVSIGDRVVRGQRIADAASPCSMTVPVHASISGIVKKIEPRRQCNNCDGLCITIEADVSTQEEFSALEPLDFLSCTKEEALVRVREAGILGMGGAGFPTYVKLAPPPNKPIDLIIADGAECEPYLTIDDACMMGKSGMLIKGLEIVMAITGVKKAIIGIEDNRKELVPLFEKEIKSKKTSVEISVGMCLTRYPQGGEKMLITALTGREVPSCGLPMDTGCIVQNVGTLIAIAEAFVLGKPLIDRPLTINGGACKTPKNVCAPIGTVLNDLVPDFVDIDFSKLAKIIYGGPMMGSAVPSLDVPIQKNTSGIILMTREETIAEEETPCIRCGRCIRKCPILLSPVIMNTSLEAGDLDYAVKAGLMDCMECGSCAYVCPARVKLVQRFRIGKQKFRMRKKQ